MRYVFFRANRITARITESLRAGNAELVPRQRNKLVSSERAAGINVLHQTRKKIWDGTRRKRIWAIFTVILLGCCYYNFKWVRSNSCFSTPQSLVCETAYFACREIGDIIPSNYLEIGFTVMLMIFNLTLFRYHLICLCILLNRVQ